MVIIGQTTDMTSAYSCTCHVSNLPINVILLPFIYQCDVKELALQLNVDECGIINHVHWISVSLTTQWRTEKSPGILSESQIKARVCRELTLCAQNCGLSFKRFSTGDRRRCVPGGGIDANRCYTVAAAVTSSRACTDRGVS
jgi:hypothetical protein